MENNEWIKFCEKQIPELKNIYKKTNRKRFRFIKLQNTYRENSMVENI